MAMHRISRGLNVCGAASPQAPVSAASPVRRVAVLTDDYPGLRPRLRVEEGAVIHCGEVLFEDRTDSSIRFTAPGSGRVVGIHRGNKRVLQSVVIELEDEEVENIDSEAHHVHFRSFDSASGSRAAAVELLCESGLWTSFRTRPFGKVPSPKATPFAIFVTAIDTQPLAPDPQIVVADASNDFRQGLLVLGRLTEGKVFLCVAPDSSIGKIDAPVAVEEFAGPHPAGLAGLHVHRLAPVSRERTVWTIGYQDVIAVGHLFLHGHLNPGRIISIAGPPVASPRLVKTRLGASLVDLTATDTFADEVRFISGSMISGKSMTKAHYGYLGRYDQQLTVLPEAREREFLGWLSPGRNRFSILPVFLSRWLGSTTKLTTSIHGAPRAIVPIGVYERVMPMDILPTFLLRALVVGDLERAEELGCLELVEEDLSLCSFVCPSKIDYGPLLRHNLAQLEHEAE